MVTWVFPVMVRDWSTEKHCSRQFLNDVERKPVRLGSSIQKHAGLQGRSPGGVCGWAVILFSQMDKFMTKFFKNEKNVHQCMKYAECAETNEKSILRFLFFETISPKICIFLSIQLLPHLLCKFEHFWKKKLEKNSFLFKHFWKKQTISMHSFFYGRHCIPPKSIPELDIFFRILEL